MWKPLAAEDLAGMPLALRPDRARACPMRAGKWLSYQPPRRLTPPLVSRARLGRRPTSDNIARALASACCWLGMISGTSSVSRARGATYRRSTVSRSAPQCRRGRPGAGECRSRAAPGEGSTPSPGIAKDVQMARIHAVSPGRRGRLNTYGATRGATTGAALASSARMSAVS
jgi:hypothetical protein